MRNLIKNLYLNLLQLNINLGELGNSEILATTRFRGPQQYLKRKTKRWAEDSVTSYPSIVTSFQFILFNKQGE